MYPATTVALTGAEREARRLARNPDHVRALKRATYQRHRERLIADQIARQQAAPEKKRAQARLLTAVRTGKLARPDVCEHASLGDCFGSIDAHHPDYLRSLDVVWLCRRHHQAEHRATLNP